MFGHSYLALTVGADDCMEVPIQRRPQVHTTGEVARVDQFVFETAPQSLDEHVVERAARPSVLMEMRRCFSGARKSAEVNCAP
jgi:hypothetical protein